MAKPYTESDTMKISLSFTRDLALEMQQFRKRQCLTWQEFMNLALDLTAHLTDDQIRNWRLARYTDDPPHQPIARQQAQVAESEAIEAAPAAAPVEAAPASVRHPSPPPQAQVATPPAATTPARPQFVYLTQSASGALQPADGQPFEIGMQYYFSGAEADTLYVCEADDDGDPILVEHISVPVRKAPAA